VKKKKQAKAADNTHRKVAKTPGKVSKAAPRGRKRKTPNAKRQTPNAKPKPEPAPPIPAQVPLAERPLSSRQEKFCLIYTSGKTATESYTAAYGNKRSAEAASSRLLTCVKVSKRIEALQQRAALAVVLTLEESLEYLRRSVLTPLGDVDERSELCQAAEYNVMGGVRGKLRRGTEDSGNEETELDTTTVKIKMVDKLKALELNARLQGWLREKVDHTHRADDGLAELLGMIRAGK
jgi:hypothetical protein